MFGAICGDILGSTAEFDEKKFNDIEKISLCLDTDHITDDSALTFAVADWLLHDIGEYYDNDSELKKKLAHRLVQYSLHIGIQYYNRNSSTSTLFYNFSNFTFAGLNIIIYDI